MKTLGVVLATVGGAGRFPVAPGTVGSAAGVGVYLLIASWAPVNQALVIAGVVVAGVWASGEAARYFGRADPSEVVIDEVAGQLVTYLATGVTLPGLLLGFVLFRLLDIVKPWPANRFERLHGGLGIMADDVMAGVYGNVLLQAAIYFLPGRL